MVVGVAAFLLVRQADAHAREETALKAEAAAERARGEATAAAERAEVRRVYEEWRAESNTALERFYESSAENTETMGETNKAITRLRDTLASLDVSIRERRLEDKIGGGRRA